MRGKGGEIEKKQRVGKEGDEIGRVEQGSGVGGRR